MNRFFTTLFALFALWMFFFLAYEARQTSNWVPVTGIVQSNTAQKRTIVYMVAGKQYSTDNEN